MFAYLTFVLRIKKEMLQTNQTLSPQTTQEPPDACDPSHGLLQHSHCACVSLPLEAPIHTLVAFYSQRSGLSSSSGATAQLLVTSSDWNSSATSESSLYISFLLHTSGEYFPLWALSSAWYHLKQDTLVSELCNFHQPSMAASPHFLQSVWSPSQPSFSNTNLTYSSSEGLEPSYGTNENISYFRHKTFVCSNRR